MKKVLGAAVILLLLSGCSSQGDESYLVIGFLKTNEHTITLQLGPDGPLYTVRSHDGDLIEARLTESELVAKLPDLRQLIEAGMADDASLDLRNSGGLDGFLESGKY